MKKILLVVMLLCMLLSIFVMISSNAYVVASCLPPFKGEAWDMIPYSYFDIGLAGDIVWFEDVLILCINLIALICNSLFISQLILKKLNKFSFIFLAVGILTSMMSLPTSTADGYPNSFPFISAIVALCVTGLLLFHLFSSKLTKPICFTISVGAVSSVFSLFMSHLITISGIIITSLYLVTISLYFIYIRNRKPLNHSLKSCSEVFCKGFPPELKKAVMASIRLIPKKTYNDVKFYVSDNEVVYSLSDYTITFPYRIYLTEIEHEKIAGLDDIGKIVLHCIYSRSCNGYVREKHIKALLSTDFPEWAIPYIVKVCDEYIVEILQMTYDNLKDKNTDVIKSFCIKNWDVFCKSYNRMISYWNEFYRNDCYEFENYIGRKLFIECFGAKRTMNCVK